VAKLILLSSATAAVLGQAPELIEEGVQDMQEDSGIVGDWNPNWNYD